MKGFNIADVGPRLFGFDQPKLKDFLEILEIWSQGQKCPGCWSGVCWEGGGNVVCLVKACAEKQGFLTCAECSKMPCNEYRGEEENELPRAAHALDLVTKRYSQWNIDNLKRIREIGYRRFLDEIQKMVKCGFLTSDVISSEMIVTESIKKRKG
jgi:hypothetical protein